MNVKKDIKKIAIIRGKFLNQYEMQSFYPLVEKYDITAFGSLTPFHSTFPFKTELLLSPMDLPDFPYKMPILNRLLVDAQYLLGLEAKLKGFSIAHTAETYYHYTQQALIAKKRGYVKKVVVTVLENIPFNNEGIWGRAAFKKRARQEVDHFIALTERTKAAMVLEGIKEQDITIVSHGIDTKRFFPHKKKYSNKHLTILFSGRLEVYKGVLDILLAAKLLLRDKELRGQKLQFLFLGEGSEKTTMVEMERTLGITKYVTHKSVSYDKVPMVYQEADLYVAPSKAAPYWVEQYNTSLLEAQASGLPIVTTYSGGIPENVGDAAILVGPGDYFALAQQLKEFILYPKKRAVYAKRARERAETVHDIHVIAKQLDKVYSKLV